MQKYKNFYIVNDILKKDEKNPQPRASTVFVR